MSSWLYTAESEAALMKVKYEKLIEDQFNKSNVLFGRFKKKTDFVGSQKEIAIVQSIGGGVGAGSLPTANKNKNGKAIVRTKKNYATVSIDRETMKAARTDEGSFVRMTAFPVKITTESFNRNLERQVTRNGIGGEGVLISGADNTANVSGAGTPADPYVLTFDSASNFPAEFAAIEEGDIVNLDSETTELEVLEMTESVVDGYSTGTISLAGTSAGLAAASGAAPFSGSLYMQNSKDKEVVGLQGVLSATSGDLYDLPVGRRWKAYQKDATGAAISTDLMNEVVVNLKRQCGKSPKMIICHHHQYIKLLNLLEDQKRYNIPSRKGEFSFSALSFMSADGEIPVTTSRFIDSDKMYFLNDDHMELHLRPGGFEWFDEDGTVFLREDSDSYEARYGGYGETFINPHFQGYLYGLLV